MNLKSTAFLKSRGCKIFLATLLLSLNGCLTSKQADRLGYEVIRQGISGVEIPYWAGLFKVQKKRWPRDYNELAGFVYQRTDAKEKLPCELGVLAHLPDGRLKVDCFTVVNGVTNSVTYWLGSDGREEYTK